jgi:integration host factor subunit beta
VTKKEIVKTISEEIGLTQLKTKEIVQKTFDAIVETLVEEERIELRNFGVFEVKKRAARKARNPRTGERVDVPEKYVVTFKPGKEMEERVRLLEERKRRRQQAEQSRAPQPGENSQAAPAADGGSGSETDKAPMGGAVGGSGRQASSSVPDAPASSASPSNNGPNGPAKSAGRSGGAESAESDDSAENNLRQPAS